jgi:hypothetical protein
MYRCAKCGAKVGPKVARRVHVLYRTVAHQTTVGGVTLKTPPRQEIAREVPVCDKCGDLLARAKPIRSKLFDRVEL